ncbi:MAG: sigma-54-dependent Fis family transcriptional regulator [Spirochaetales bacterium]|nr:sigma-54-dependent Fis family transcriptional regulator [Spirochaetales bacterium]
MKQVFVLSSSKAHLLALVAVARRIWEVYSVEHPRDSYKLLSEKHWDAAIVDLDVSGIDLYDFCSFITRLDKAPHLFLVCRGGFPQAHERAATSSLVTMISLSGDVRSFIHAVSAVLDSRRNETSVLNSCEKADKEALCSRILLGISPAIRDVRSRLKRYASLPHPVLITGETGSGKDLAARLLHDISIRANGPYEAVNVSCIPESLAETFLFGSLRGGYTGSKDLPGCFERADTGTLFLDEIGTMPVAIQPRFLRVVEEGCVTRVGSAVKKKVSCRLVCATNAKIGDAESTERFREDLLFRLDCLRVKIPPLRERREDIPLLAGHCLGALGKNLSDSALRKIMKHEWPGNVRQLFQCLRRAAADSDSCLIDPDLIQF